MLDEPEFLLVLLGTAEVLAIDESNLDSLSTFDFFLSLWVLGMLSGGILGCCFGSSFFYSTFMGDLAGTGTTLIDLLLAEEIELLLSGDASFFEGGTIWDLAGDGIEGFGGGISFLTGSGFLEAADVADGLLPDSGLGVGAPGVINTLSLTIDLSFLDLLVFEVIADTLFGFSSLLDLSKFYLGTA